MKHLKRLSVGCLLATATLVIGVASASAEQSTFCKVNETPCSSANHYPIGTELSLISKGPVKWVGYLFGFEYVKQECSEMTLKGKTTTTGGSSQTVEVPVSELFLSYAGCGGSIITYESPRLKFSWTSGTMNASVTTTGFSFGFGGSGCAFFGENITEGTTLTSGNPAVLTFKEAGPVTPSAGCGKTAKFSGEFEVASPKPLYISNS